MYEGKRCSVSCSLKANITFPDLDKLVHCAQPLDILIKVLLQPSQICPACLVPFRRALLRGVAVCDVRSGLGKAHVIQNHIVAIAYCIQITWYCTLAQLLMVCSTSNQRQAAASGLQSNTLDWTKAKIWTAVRSCKVVIGVFSSACLTLWVYRSLHHCPPLQTDPSISTCHKSVAKH